MDYIDGGNTAALLAGVDNSPTEYSTYQSLYAQSPFLSDEVLASIGQATEMPEWQRGNLLIMNSPLTDSVMIAVDPYISDYTYQFLEAIRYYDRSFGTQRVGKPDFGNRAHEKRNFARTAAQIHERKQCGRNSRNDGTKNRPNLRRECWWPLIPKRATWYKHSLC